MSTLKLCGTVCWLCFGLAFITAAQDREAQLAEAERLNQQVLEFYQAGRYAEAISLTEHALAIREKILGPAHPDVAQSLNNLAELYKVTGDYARAVPLLQRALAIDEKALGPEHIYVATELNNLARLYDALGDSARAVPLLQRALAIYEKVLGPEHPGVAATLNNLALIYDAKGDYARAAPLFQRTLAIVEKTLGPEHPNTARTLDNLAGLYKNQGDYARAAPLYQRALAIREKVLGPQHPDVANSFNSLALLYDAQGDYARAAPLYQRALAVREKALGPQHPDVALTLNNLAGLYYSQGQYGPAVSSLQRAAEIREKNIAAILSVGSQQQKQLYLNRLDGETYAAVSLHTRAAPHNAAAARLALTTILRRKGRALDAFTSQLDALRRRAMPEDKKLLDELAAAQSQLANLQLGGSKLTPEARQAEVSRLEAVRERLEDTIGRRSAEFRNTQQTVTLERVQAALPADAALVEMFVYQPFNAQARGAQPRYGAARYVAYVVRRNDAAPQFADLGDAATIDAAAAKFRAVLQSPKTPAPRVKAAARALDERVMRPVRRLLGTNKRVLLAPDGALNLVPFAALVAENGRYLVETYDFNYLTSGREVLRYLSAGASQDAPTIIANPRFDLTRSVVDCRQTQRNLGLVTAGPPTEARTFDFAALCYQTLAGTATEAQALGALWPQSRVWTQDAANEAALKAVNRPRILHIATHGFFLPDQTVAALTDTRQSGFGEPATRAVSFRETPLLRSGLILAGVNQKQSGPDNDGVLTAQEAAGLDLYGTKLVVLSACETGLGEVQNGAGVYGLRRALVLAGSETQVMSLWAVSDAATRDLMIAYYRRLQAGAGRISAMREVQLAMLRGAKWQQPYYWAAFIPSGAWTPLEN